MTDIDLQSLARVFRTAYPWDRPWNEASSFRAIVGLVLDELSHSQFDAISDAAGALGEEEALFAFVGAGPSHQNYWPDSDAEALQSVSFSDYSTYALSNAQLKRRGVTALWSPSGAWAILMLPEWFALVGGEEEFGMRLREGWPTWPHEPREGAGVPFDSQVELFVDEIVASRGPDIARPVLEQAYGEEGAARLLSETRARTPAASTTRSSSSATTAAPPSSPPPP